MTGWSATTRKLLLGFAAVLATFVASSWLTLSGLGRIHAAIERTRQEEEGVRLALELASAVRDQYAHQAHTIIIGDASHMPLYAGAERRVLELTRALRAHARGEDELAWMTDIEGASGRLDVIFRQRIVPAVLGHDQPFVQAEHARAQLVVSEIQDRAARLVGRFEERIADARAEAGAVERRTYRSILALLVIAPLLATGAALYLGRSIATPVRRLHAGAAQIGAGDLDTRIDIATHDEFGALARQFNAMAASVAEHQAALVRSEKLAGVGRLAAGVAHEINNPLGVILGYVRLLRKRADRALDEDLAVVEEEALRCKEIVDGLLDLARPLQAGREPVDLRAVSDEVVARLREARVLEGVDVAVGGAGSADGNPNKLRQVLTNLVRNAAEAAGPGGRVRVEVAELDGEARTEVRDSGPGLTPQVQARLFEPFFTTKGRGTGLGLAVSRAIARAHGGDVVAASAPEGGASFTLRLPRPTTPTTARRDRRYP